MYWCAGTPHSAFSCFLIAAAAASCRLYHTVPQALKLSTLWQSRYISSRTASLCGPLLLRRQRGNSKIRWIEACCHGLLCAVTSGGSPWVEDRRFIQQAVSAYRIVTPAPGSRGCCMLTSTLNLSVFQRYQCGKESMQCANTLKGIAMTPRMHVPSM